MDNEIKWTKRDIAAISAVLLALAALIGDRLGFDVLGVLDRSMDTVERGVELHDDINDRLGVTDATQ